jgi:tetratricopeptide (TPR) repeat protein
VDFTGSLSDQAQSLQASGDLDGAMELYKEQERICRESGNSEGLVSSLSNQGAILGQQAMYIRVRDLNGAMRLYKQQESLFQEIGDVRGVIASLGYQGRVLQAKGDALRAMAVFQEQERISRELGDPHALKEALDNQARLHGALANQDVGWFRNR